MPLGSAMHNPVDKGSVLPSAACPTGGDWPGSGASLLANFFASGAQVFISGDLRYHDARAVEAYNLGLIDIGHFPSEHLIVDVLAERLASIFADSKINLTVKAYGIEKDPFTVL